MLRLDSAATTRGAAMLAGAAGLITTDVPVRAGSGSADVDAAMADFVARAVAAVRAVVATAQDAAQAVSDATMVTSANDRATARMFAR